MKVYVDVDHWGFSDDDEKFRFFSRHTPGNVGVWNDLTLVRDYHAAECVVCFDSRCKNHRANGKKVIQVKQEPSAIQPYSRYPLADAYVDYQSDVHATFWFIDRPYDWLESLKHSDALVSKNTNCSAVFSNKHAYRNSFFSRLSSAVSGVDYFGRGIESIVGLESYRGPLIKNGLCKLDGLLPYQKSIALENSQQPDYFTEKLIDCFMTWTMPIYFGCPNITEIFPRDSMRIIDVNNIEDAIEKILEPLAKIELEALGAARQMALKKYNFWAALERAVERL